MGLRYAETGAPEGKPWWTLLLAYFQASQVAEFITVQATYDELRSAGDLEPMAARKLVDTLAANQGLMEELRYWMSNMQVTQLIADDRLAAATALKRMIATSGLLSEERRSP